MLAGVGVFEKYCWVTTIFNRKIRDPGGYKSGLWTAKERTILFPTEGSCVS